MLNIIIWSLVAFFSVFGLIEFVRFLYIAILSEHEDYHVVVFADNNEENMESIVRLAMLATDAQSLIVLYDNSSPDTKTVLYNLKNKYSHIIVMTMEEYMDFIHSKEC